LYQPAARLPDDEQKRRVKITRERDSARPASKNECVVSDYFECECFLKFRHAQRKKTPLASRAFNEVIATAINGGIVIMHVPIFNAGINVTIKKMVDVHGQPIFPIVKDSDARELRSSLITTQTGTLREGGGYLVPRHAFSP